MSGRIYLLRHGEAAHNVTQNFDLPDPPLTSPLGESQAQSFAETFPHRDGIAVVITSPLRRTIQTTLRAFPHAFNAPNSASGEGGFAQSVELILSPDVQESSNLPCDTGSDIATLSAEFPYLDFSKLPKRWNVKEGKYAAEKSVVQERAAEVRRVLYEKLSEVDSLGSKRKDIVVVTHGGFMKHLTGDPTIDLPKAGWKRFRLEKRVNGDEETFDLEPDVSEEGVES
jgi:broad specificity phosphatase PhoE